MLEFLGFDPLLLTAKNKYVSVWERYIFKETAFQINKGGGMSFTTATLFAKSICKMFPTFRL